jgi:HAD superfamily hydrolase (TIGR01509 family)
MTGNAIRNVVFDVGGVLVRLQFAPIIRFLSDSGVDMRDIPAWLERIDLVAHERGEFGGEELLARIRALATRPIDAQELHRHWLGMFERAHDMFDLLEALRARHRVFLLSNVGDLHWTHLDRSYGLEACAHGAIASFRVGQVKPSAAIYRIAEREFGIEPAATVFIDDLLPNVQAARAAGWQSIHHGDFTATRAALDALGIRP